MTPNTKNKSKARKKKHVYPDRHPRVEIGQIWQGPNSREGVERFLRVIEVRSFEALVRSCLRSGEFCTSTPRTWMPLSHLRNSFLFRSNVTVFEYDTLAQT